MSHGRVVAGVTGHVPGYHAAVIWLFSIGQLEGHGTSIGKQRYDQKKKNKRCFSSAPSSYVVLGQAVTSVKFLGLLPQLCGCSAQGHRGHSPDRAGLQGQGALESSYKSPFLFHCIAQLA